MSKAGGLDPASVGLWLLIAALFVGLKLDGQIGWSWWLVLWPFWPLVPVFLLFVLGAALRWKDGRG